MKNASLVVVILCALLFALPALGQIETGEVRLTITDPSGLGVKSSVTVVSEAKQYRETLETDESGHLEVKRLPFGPYQITIHSEGFAESSQAIQITSPLPQDLAVKLQVATVASEVTVAEAPTLVDPRPTSPSVKEIGSEQIETRVTSLPGRSLQELINDQPGWLFEGNGVLHPRGSENQTQLVLDGIPLTDNRSPGFSPEIPAEDVEDAKVYTAGYPAEYGSKLGGVISVDTLGATQPGLHGHTVLSGGSYDTANAYSELQYTWKRNTVGLSGSGSRTDHYLNPLVPENLHNAGTTATWAASFERDLTPRDRITMTVRHGLARFQLPNELVQQEGGFLLPADADPTETCPPFGPLGPECVFVPAQQRQTAANYETIGTAIYQHVFSDNAVVWLRGMVRNKQLDFNSNEQSWPIIAEQHNEFTEGYFSASLALHHGRHDLKFGIESTNRFLHERFRYHLPSNLCLSSDDPSLNDPACPLNLGIFDVGTPLQFPAGGGFFVANRPDLEQAAYAVDTIRLGKWTINGGLRWDHYQLLVNEHAVSPRVSVSRYFPSAGVLLHASYDRIFETPFFENILLSSSGALASELHPVEQNLVRPSHGNFYEAGVTKGFNDHLRVDVNYFLRRESNVADDDTLLNTVAAFPIAWDHAVVYGAEAKITVPQWWHFSGWVSYAYQVATTFFPVRGGLLLEAKDLATSGHFPATQDQRNTVRSRIRYQVIPRLWVAFGVDYNSGLPFEQVNQEISPEQAAAQARNLFGPGVVSQVNFNRGRILPQMLENASVGFDLYKRKEREMRLQFDVANLSNELNVVDFGGLFSANVIGPARSYYGRLSMRF